MDNKFTYFGLEIVKNKDNVVGVKESDIKKLPFYDLWCKKSIGSTCALYENDDKLIYLHDWEKFSKLFIKTGK